MGNDNANATVGFPGRAQIKYHSAKSFSKLEMMSSGWIPWIALAAVIAPAACGVILVDLSSVCPSLATWTYLALVYERILHIGRR